MDSLTSKNDKQAIQLFTSLSDEQLWVPLPSYTNTMQLSYSVTDWCIMYQRTELLDHLMTRRSTCLLIPLPGSPEHHQLDALTFAIKMNKQIVVDHILSKYSDRFDLINGSYTTPWSHPQMSAKLMNLKKVSYDEQLKYAHGLEKRFHKQRNQQYESNV